MKQITNAIKLLNEINVENLIQNINKNYSMSVLLK